MKAISSWLILIAFAFGTFHCNGQTLDSLDIKIGQMILIGFPGPAVDEKSAGGSAAG